jgi:hypothetical protein
MSVDITIRVPDELGRQLERYRDRLPELLARGLRDVEDADVGGEGTESDIVGVLTSQPTPEQVLALKPSDKMQARVSDLLQLSTAGTLSKAEEIELDRYLYLEHLVRLAKARALEQISPDT